MKKMIMNEVVEKLTSIANTRTVSTVDKTYLLSCCSCMKMYLEKEKTELSRLETTVMYFANNLGKRCDNKVDVEDRIVTAIIGTIKLYRFVSGINSTEKLSLDLLIKTRKLVTVVSSIYQMRLFYYKNPDKPITTDKILMKELFVESDIETMNNLIQETHLIENDYL